MGDSAYACRKVGLRHPVEFLTTVDISTQASPYLLKYQQIMRDKYKSLLLSC